MPSLATDVFEAPGTPASELEQLESDVFTHVHLENHVLQPRFAAA